MLGYNQLVLSDEMLHEIIEYYLNHHMFSPEMPVVKVTSAHHDGVVKKTTVNFEVASDQPKNTNANFPLSSV